MSEGRKAGYYWVKYVSRDNWSIEYWNGGMWFTRNPHLVEDSMFSTIDETPIEREPNISKQQSNCNKPAVSGSVLNINLHEYGYSCGDGCCYNYGTITTVNKTELPCHNQDAGTILRQVLEHLGYCVEITYSDDVS